MNYKNINSNLFKSNFVEKNFSLLVNITILLLIPFLLHEQFLTGILVNAILIKSALDFKEKKVYLIAFMPSIAVFASGFMLGTLNGALLSMLPFIFAGNLVLMFGVRKLFVEKKLNYWLASTISVSVKVLLLGASAFILFSFGQLVPLAFLTIFGLNQLITGICGAGLFFAYNSTIKKNAMFKK